MRLPLHRWFRYSAGFSAKWANELIVHQKALGRKHVLDPFAGSGTVLIEAENCGVASIGIEAHIFVSRVAHAKLNSRVDPEIFLEHSRVALRRAQSKNAKIERYPSLIQRCYPNEVLQKLDQLRQVIDETHDGSDYSELLWLTLTSILRECSPVGTAQWQYVLPEKSKSRSTDPFEAFNKKANLMHLDIAYRNAQDNSQLAVLYQDDARECSLVKDNWADLVVTSPPYANNYDYADATRLELSFWGEVNNWGDLHNVIRRNLIRSCAQHVSKDREDLNILLSDRFLSPIAPQIEQVCRELEIVREKHGGRKHYHTMIAAYFSDMARVWTALRRVTHENSLICVVIGDSAPYGIYVPVENWLGMLAIASGFTSYKFEKLRDRNVKWKNRKHSTPLHEGILWVMG